MNILASIPTLFLVVGFPSISYANFQSLREKEVVGYEKRTAQNWTFPKNINKTSDLRDEIKQEEQRLTNSRVCRERIKKDALIQSGEVFLRLVGNNIYQAGDYGTGGGEGFGGSWCNVKWEKIATIGVQYNDGDYINVYHIEKGKLCRYSKRINYGYDVPVSRHCYD